MTIVRVSIVIAKDVFAVHRVDEQGKPSLVATSTARQRTEPAVDRFRRPLSFSLQT